MGNATNRFFCLYISSACVINANANKKYERMNETKRADHSDKGQCVCIAVIYL